MSDDYYRLPGKKKKSQLAYALEEVPEGAALGLSSGALIGMLNPMNIRKSPLHRALIAAGVGGVLGSALGSAKGFRRFKEENYPKPRK